MAKAQPKDQTEEEMQQQDANVASRPAARFSGSGGLSAAVWKNASPDDDARYHYSVRIERTYKDANGNYQSTPYLREGDLLRAQKLLGQADDWIEQDKAKQRSASSGREQGAGR